MHFDVCCDSAADEESFEDNPEEYIRRDMEGSDIDTRRRAACDLVRALSKSFEGPVISNFSQYVQAMLAVSILFHGNAHTLHVSFFFVCDCHHCQTGV